MRCRLTTLSLAVIFVAAMLAGCGGAGQSPTGSATNQAPSGPASIQSDDGGLGLIVTPINVYFRMRDKIPLIPIADALNKYKASNGHFPKSHQEFVDKIISEQPALMSNMPPRTRLIYHPEKAADLDVCTTNRMDELPLSIEHSR